MKIRLRELNGKVWTDVNIKDLKGTSILRFIASSDVPTVGAVYDDDKPVLFITNSEEQRLKYKEKGASFMAIDLQELVAAEMMPSALVEACEKVFGGGTFIELQVKEKEEPVTRNQIYKPNVSKIAYEQDTTQMELLC